MKCYLVAIVLTFAMSACVAPSDKILKASSGITRAQEQPRGNSYAQKIRAAIIKNINFIDTIEGNPAAQLKVTTRPNGEIVNTELVESSGNAGWDKAVRIAVIKTERIPLDTDGTVPPVLYITFRPKP